MGFATDCIHAGQEPDPTTGAVTVPIYQTSTYVQEGLGQHKGYEYARTHNLTRRTLEKNLAALEGGTDAYCYASGMAATQAVLTLVKAGPARRGVGQRLRRHPPALHEDPRAVRRRVRVPRRERPRGLRGAGGPLRPAVDRDARPTR